MGLRCLLGHDFGAPEIERERAEDGNEMVITIREVETCSRCGTERVVSENKEVTSIRTPDEVGLDRNEGGDATDATAGGAEAAAGDATDAGPARDASSTDAGGSTGGVDGAATAGGPGADATEDVEFIDDGPVDAGVETADAETADAAEDAAEADASGFIDAAEDRIPGAGDGTDDAGGGPDAHASAEADDGVILDDDADRVGGGDSELDDPSTDVDVERDAVAEDEGTDAEFVDGAGDETAAGDAPGSTDASPADDGPTPWPEHDDVAPPEERREPQPWPEVEGEDEGFAAESGGSTGDVSFSGLTPTKNGSAAAVESAAADAEYVRADATGQGDVVRPDAGTTVEGSAPAGPTEYFCGACGAAWDAGSSSLRPGDICPECKRGYVGERER